MKCKLYQHTDYIWSQLVKWWVNVIVGVDNPGTFHLTFLLFCIPESWALPWTHLMLLSYLMSSLPWWVEWRVANLSALPAWPLGWVLEDLFFWTPSAAHVILSAHIAAYSASCFCLAEFLGSSSGVQARGRIPNTVRLSIESQIFVKIGKAALNLLRIFGCRVAFFSSHTRLDEGAWQQRGLDSCKLWGGTWSAS